MSEEKEKVVKEEFFVAESSFVLDKKQEKEIKNDKFSCKLTKKDEETIEIIGKSQDDIDKCKFYLVEEVLSKNKNYKQPLTHFFSIAIGHEKEFQDLKDLIEKNFPKRIRRFLYQSTESLHFTLFVMTLNGKNDIERMKKIMTEKITPILSQKFGKSQKEDTKDEILDNEVEFEGMDFFGKDSKDARVIFLKSNEKKDITSRLISFRNEIFKILRENSFLVKNEDRDFKLHATVAKGKKRSDNMNVSDIIGNSILVNHIKNNLKFTPNSLQLSKFELKKGSFYTKEFSVNFPSKI